jgi:peptidoglycan-N-acetylglucosamine deacetylase
MPPPSVASPPAAVPPNSGLFPAAPRRPPADRSLPLPSPSFNATVFGSEIRLESPEATMKNALMALLLMCCLKPLFAYGPETVAVADRSLWPETMNSTAAFDRASRAEILVFAAALAEVAEQDAATLKTQLNIKQVDAASVARVRNQLTAHLLLNWRIAAADCANSEVVCENISTAQELLTAAKGLEKNLPESYRNWYNKAQLFHKSYAGELIRLAALFPKVSSEIDTFSALEHTGFEPPDRHFVLTFDDGPSQPDGNTDTLLALLTENNLHASFYMLGERLQARLKQAEPATPATLFHGQCAAMHGWRHESHAKWEKWQSSIIDTRDLVKATFPQSYQPWFRPPYGQRRADSAEFFSRHDLKVALWNIDSQDWNRRVSGEDAAQRIMTLMLLWRRGVILFHDIHPKALVAVPWLLDHTQETGVVWQDCREY